LNTHHQFPTEDTAGGVGFGCRAPTAGSVQILSVTRRTVAAKPRVNSLEGMIGPAISKPEGRPAMPNYENYYDVLSENAAPRHVVGSSAVVVLLLAIAALAVSVF
jgi:hypothetical protein